MADRVLRQRTLSRLERVVANAVAVVKGEVATLDLNDSSKLEPVTTDATLLPIGYFEASGTGDGTTKFGVVLFKEVLCEELDNDATTPVTDAMVGTNCWLKDGKTVSADSTGRSLAGRIWAVSSSPNKVLVEMAMTGAGIVV